MRLSVYGSSPGQVSVQRGSWANSFRLTEIAFTVVMRAIVGIGIPRSRIPRGPDFGRQFPRRRRQRLVISRLLV